MAQRGGSVLTFVRYGTAVHAPLIEQRQADYLFALEKLEAWRLLPYLRTGGTLVCSTQEIKPMPVIIGQQQYPPQIIPALEALAADGTLGKFLAINALEVACACRRQKLPMWLCWVLARTLVSGGQFSPRPGSRSAGAFPAANREAFLAGFHAVLRRLKNSRVSARLCYNVVYKLCCQQQRYSLHLFSYTDIKKRRWGRSGAADRGNQKLKGSSVKRR